MARKTRVSFARIAERRSPSPNQHGLVPAGQQTQASFARTAAHRNQKQRRSKPGPARAAPAMKETSARTAERHVRKSSRICAVNRHTISVACPSLTPPRARLGTYNKTQPCAGSFFSKWCPRRESNSHGFPTVFETAASAIPPLGRNTELYRIMCFRSRKSSQI